MCLISHCLPTAPPAAQIPEFSSIDPEATFSNLATPERPAPQPIQTGMCWLHGPHNWELTRIKKPRAGQFASDVRKKQNKTVHFLSH